MAWRCSCEGSRNNSQIEAIADSNTADLIVTVDGNGAALEDHKVDSESQVTITKGGRECKVVVNNHEESDLDLRMLLQCGFAWTFGSCVYCY